MTELALGTVQFGLDYGATNRRGRVGSGIARDILTAFADDGGHWLDTAPAYGDSEIVLGRQSGVFSIVDKTVHIDPNVDPDAAVFELDKGLDESLRRLNRKRLDVLLCHQAWLLRPPFREPVLAWSRRRKERGDLIRFGVSIYSPQDLDDDMLSGLDWVQFPLNALDQRMLTSGWIDRLNKAGIVTQARSLYLQGVLLAPEKSRVEVPREAAEAIAAFHRVAKHRALTAESLALAVGCQAQVSQVVAGVNSLVEYHTLRQAWKAAQRLGRADIDWSECSLGDHPWLIPSNWNPL